MLRADIAKWIPKEAAEHLADMIELGTQAFAVVGKLLEEEQFMAAKTAYGIANENLARLHLAVQSLRENAPLNPQQSLEDKVAALENKVAALENAADKPCCSSSPCLEIPLGEETPPCTAQVQEEQNVELPNTEAAVS